MSFTWSLDETSVPGRGRSAERSALRLVSGGQPATGMPADADAHARPGRAAGSHTVRCRSCGEPIVVEWASVVSSHRSSSGAVAYVRCPCGGIGLALGGGARTA
jgi:hypothetical protein